MTDSALVLNTIAGHDAKDSTSLKIEYPDYTQFLKNDVQGLRIGLPQEYFNNENSALVDKIKEVAQKLEELGAIVESVLYPIQNTPKGSMRLLLLLKPAPTWLVMMAFVMAIGLQGLKM